MRKSLVLAICFVTFAGLWWGRCATTNDERAYVVRDRQLFRVEMTGWRLPMAHDPFSLVLNRTRPAHFTLTLPRIEGVVEGADVRGSGGQRYAGRVVITQLKMEVELYDVDGGERHALPWNGEYTLVYKDASR